MGADDEVKVAPVAAAPAPEFPRRGVALALAGGAALVLGAGPAQAKKPASQGSIDGKPPGENPHVRVTRGHGIHASAHVDESDVLAFLTWQFAHHGLDIQRSYILQYEGTTVECDGFDPVRNVGFVHHFGAHGRLDPQVKQRLAEWQKQNVAAILYLDDAGTPDEPTLTTRVERFFKALKRAMPKPGRLGPPAGRE
jgi:hypothetical protein